MTNYYPPSSTGPTDVGPYRLVRMIGEGGMGAVYYALRRSDNLAVALKILPRSLAMDNDQLARFRREAAVAMGLDHPNVVGCLDVDQSDGYNFMVMEFVGGGDAEELLRRSGGRISERRAMSISLDITKALHHASSFGLVHRDIKPENLLFTESGMAKLTDFGLVKRTAENLRITERGKAMGTPHFMAPEQARGKRDLDVRSDIYSLGATIYYLLSGQTPYNGNSAFEIVSQLASEPPPPLTSRRPDLSPSCLFIIECMMARDLEDRPQSAKDLLVMIEAYFNGRPIPHPRELTKPEKSTDTPAEGRKGDSHNPMKKLKAAEFQSTPQGQKQLQPGEIPPNTITRHFMTSPTRIMSKGGAAPPPPAPEAVSMPTAGMKVPLTKANEGRRGAAQPSDTAAVARAAGAQAAPPPAPQPTALRGATSQVPSPSKLGPPPPAGVPPQALPMGIPVGQPFPGEGFPPQAYPPADESGEQIAADLDLPLPNAQFPLTPPAGIPASAPRTGRSDTVFMRRKPAAEPEPSLYESGELIAEEPSAAAPPSEAAPATPPPQVPGPVTARFRMISTPPPEAYLSAEGAAAEDAETPPPEAYIHDSGAVAAPGALPTAEPPAAAEADEAAAEAAPTTDPAGSDAPATADSADAPEDAGIPTTTASDSGVANPVATSDPAQPELSTSPEIIARIALNGSSAIRPAVADVNTPVEASPAAADSSPSEPATADDGVPTPAVSESEANAAESELTPSPAAIDATPTDDSAALAEATTDAGETPTAETAPAETPAAEPPIAATETVGEPVGAPPEATPDLAAAAPATVPDMPADAAIEAAAVLAPDAGAQTPPVPVTNAQLSTFTPPALPAWSPAPGSSPPAEAPSEPVPSPLAEAAPAASVAPAVASAPSEIPSLQPPAPPGPVAPVITDSAPPAAVPAGLWGSPAPAPLTPPAGLEPGLTAVASPAAPTAAPTADSEADSLLARVRRLQTADTMAPEVSPLPKAVSAQPEAEESATENGAWKYLAVGFIGGVLITLALVLLLR